MLGFSHSLGYAIQVLSRLDDRNPQRIRELPLVGPVPRPYLAKLINRLAHEGLVETKRGRGGGVILARSASKISLLQVVKAIEGSQWVDPCLLGMEACVALQFCPFTDFWKETRTLLEDMLKRTTLADVLAFRKASVRRGQRKRRDLGGDGEVAALPGPS